MNLAELIDEIADVLDAARLGNQELVEVDSEEYDAGYREGWDDAWHNVLYQFSRSLDNIVPGFDREAFQKAAGRR